MAELDEDFSSDSSDEDYVPTADKEVGSEEEDSGEDEDFHDDNEDEQGGQKKRAKRDKTKTQKDTYRRKKGGIRLEDDVEDTVKEEDNYNKELSEQIHKDKEVKEVEKEKKRVDSLWADFMKDVGGAKPKPKPTATDTSLASLSQTCRSGNKTSISNVPAKTCTIKPTKVTITKEYDFAGETVKITKEVDAESKEAKAEVKKTENSTDAKPQAGSSLAGVKRPGGGLGNVLGKIGKKQKMSTLVKSKLDWDSFKKEEGIVEDLETHNRGKEGYLERVAFLERTDVRQYEAERDIRLKTMNTKR